MSFYLVYYFKGIKAANRTWRMPFSRTLYVNLIFKQDSTVEINVTLPMASEIEETINDIASSATAPQCQWSEPVVGDGGVSTAATSSAMEARQDHGTHFVSLHSRRIGHPQQLKNYLWSNWGFMKLTIELFMGPCQSLQ